MVGSTGRGRGKRAGLTRHAIVTGGLELAREVNAAGFSVRLLASRLGVDPMAIHYWFRGREQLLDAVASRALETVPIPDRADSWESSLRGCAAHLWAVVTSHPGVGWSERALEGPSLRTPMAAAILEIITLTGLPERDATATARALLGLAIAEAHEADEARFRAGVSLVIDGLRMRLLERRAAAGER